MSNVYDVLKARGFVEQVSDEEGLRAALEQPSRCYIGYDPSASSLHVGHLMTLMTLAHMQQHGHRPIALVGGGTGMIGDPSGRTEMRQLLTVEQIQSNVQALKAQIGRYIEFGEDKATLVNNADWLLELKYIDFLREIGRHFSVNRMLAAEAYRSRMEAGLSFIEFNYQLLQAYDFLYLYQHYDCILQMGGNDQWGNILAGVELIRRVADGQAFALTFPLITTASGAKMGKTAQGAVWLDANRLAPYDFYQFWINTEDADVERFLKLYTFLSLEEIAELGKLQGAEIRKAKEVLAFEVTRLTHGEQAALEAQEAARSLFRGAGESDAIPTTEMSADTLAAGVAVADLFQQTGLAKSRSEARRLIQQGGAYVNDQQVSDVDQVLTLNDLEDNRLLLRAGKKRYHRVTVAE
ncbi:MAG: tyrosine--tRNA ligase [Chloroflexi bacterium]|jgi:tyrosyl-tRNA synthetase|nr:tyrosine--tRNA ligase [Chloroflexota bacterium]